VKCSSEMPISKSRALENLVPQGVTNQFTNFDNTCEFDIMA